MSETKEPPPGVRLREIARECFTLFRSPEGDVYGTARDTPGRAIRHGRPSDLCAEICLAYLDRWGTWPSAAAQAELGSWIDAVVREVRPVPLRSHWDTQRLLLDVGDAEWTTLCIDHAGIHQLNGDRPLAFRRSPTTAALPWSAGTRPDLAPLWRLVPIVAADRPVVLALLVTSWLTGVPQPVVLLTGPQDSGKTATAQFLLNLVDPVNHQRGGSLPEGQREWKVRAGVSRVVLVDNASHINARASDMLCRVATGGEMTTRELYTDDAAHISDMLIPVWLTSIDSGVLRGDLQSRLVKIELTGLTKESRLAMSDLSRAQKEAAPVIVRALIEMTALIMKLLPNIDRSELPHRMTDFNLVLRCVDQLLGSQGELRFTGRGVELAEDVIEADQVALAILRLLGEPGHPTVKTNRLKEGLTASQLHDQLWELVDRDLRRDGFPKTPKVLSDRLRRLAPALAEARGVAIDFYRLSGGASGGRRNRLVSIKYIDMHR